MLVPFCYIFLYLWGTFSITCQSKSVPNLYVFGDSIVDHGPKSYHATGLKTGYLPYGTECLFMDKSRFTNGRIIPEYISKHQSHKVVFLFLLFILFCSEKGCYILPYYYFIKRQTLLFQEEKGFYINKLKIGYSEEENK